LNEHGEPIFLMVTRAIAPTIPQGAVEIAAPPAHGLMRMVNGAWQDTPALAQLRAKGLA
jgi:hypothetical protein